MSVRHIKKNDMVTVMAGASAGKTGKVLQVIPSSGRAVIEGVKLVKKNLRRTQERPQGGIIEKEAPIALSSLMLHCPTCKKGVRIQRSLEAAKTVRKCRKCGHAFDA